MFSRKHSKERRVEKQSPLLHPRKFIILPLFIQREDKGISICLAPTKYQAFKVQSTLVIHGSFGLYSHLNSGLANTEPLLLGKYSVRFLRASGPNQESINT